MVWEDGGGDPASYPIRIHPIAWNAEDSGIPRSVSLFTLGPIHERMPNTGTGRKGCAMTKLQLFLVFLALSTAG